MTIDLHKIGKDEDEQVTRLAYERLVADRLDVSRWLLPNRWRHSDSIRRVCYSARNIDADPVEFVLAQFLFLNEKECKEYFGLRYIPVEAMTSKKAKSRYERWRRAREMPEELTIENIARRIRYDCTLVELVKGEEHRVLLLLASGAVSAWYVAARRDLDDMSEEDVWRLLSGCPDHVKGDYGSALAFITSRNKKEKTWLLRNALGLPSRKTGSPPRK